MSENINKSLVQIQQSLTKIDSAREQVEKVADTGTEFTSATKALAHEVKQMADVIKNETSSVINSFSSSLADFEQKVHGSIDSGDQSISQKLKTFKETAEKLESFANAELKNVNNQSAELIKKYETDLANKINAIVTNFSGKLVDFEEKIGTITQDSQNGISEKIEDFKNSAGTLKEISEKSINEARSLASETIKNQEEEIAKAIETIIANFSDKLIDLEKKNVSITEKSQNSIIKEFENFNNSVIKLKSTSEEVITGVKEIAVKTIDKQASQSEDIIKALVAYSEEMHKLIQQISETNFSTELNKLHKEVNQTHNDNLIIQEKIKTMEKDVTERLIQSIEMQERLIKKQQINTYITWALILLSAGGVFVLSNYKYFISLF
ncbi:hypothetical protein [Carboxylicivirga sp. N1Y90]|uniref:hypothetical protein n=1 Tax=Carboxylicivirga fragile TaxID=3417571 RepID=UPI003D33B2A4|nr:hypothetical protein [Marinilabiliaceae bacterium N1Y90]